MKFGKEDADRIWKMIKGTSFKELLELSGYIRRGFFLRYKIDRCGKFLQANKHIQVIKKNCTVELGDYVKIFSNVKLSVTGGEGKALLKIGNHASIGNRTEIHCGKEITIGDNCIIAWDVVIMDWDYHRLNGKVPVRKPVHIEDNVWIGCRAIILKGVTIGKGSVVAAGSVVTRDVPPNTLVAGNPAKIVKTDVYWDP
jgi:acetyltransferase-like isoleucine patch superfamily enzyme